MSRCFATRCFATRRFSTPESRLVTESNVAGEWQHHRALIRPKNRSVSTNPIDSALLCRPCYFLWPSRKNTRIAFKKASNGSLAYDLCESDQLAGEMQSSNTSLQYSYPNEPLMVKQENESVLCSFLSLFGLTTLLFSLTTVHGVVTCQLAPLRFDPWKVWLLFDNICIECTKV